MRPFSLAQLNVPHGVVLGDPAEDDALLRSFLLDKLSGAERRAVEQRLLADHSFFEAACALEGDLLADYAAGELTRQEEAVVRSWLAGSAQARARLGLIRALVGAAS